MGSNDQHRHIRTGLYASAALGGCLRAYWGQTMKDHNVEVSEATQF